MKNLLSKLNPLKKKSKTAKVGDPGAAAPAVDVPTRTVRIAGQSRYSPEARTPQGFPCRECTGRHRTTARNSVAGRIGNEIAEHGVWAGAWQACPKKAAVPA